MTNYIAGALVRTTATFANIAGVLTDPTTVTLKYRIGTGSVVTEAYNPGNIVRDATGVYHYDVDTTSAPGSYQLLWTGTGAVQAPGVDNFSVDPTPF